MAVKKRCEEAFNQALANRKKYPLNQGAYKLDEVRTHCKKWFYTVDKIGEWKSDPKLTPPPRDLHLGSCMASEAHVWLERLPSQIAYEVGYNIQPAIPALAGDGVLKQRISQLENHFYPRIKELVESCDKVREFLRVPENMETESDDMVLGYSKAGWLIKELEKISALILVTVPSERDYSVYMVAKEMKRSKRDVLEELELELPRHLILKDADCV